MRLLARAHFGVLILFMTALPGGASDEPANKAWTIVAPAESWIERGTTAEINVKLVEGVYLVNGDPNWQLSGIPAQLEVHLFGEVYGRRKTTFRFRPRDTSRFSLLRIELEGVSKEHALDTLRLLAAPGRAFGPRTVDLVQKTLEPMAEREARDTFPGVTPEALNAALTWVWALGGKSVARTTFQGDAYLDAGLLTPGPKIVSRHGSPHSLAARYLSRRAIPAVRLAGALVDSGLGGLTFEVYLYDSSATLHRVRVYVPAGEVGRFARSEITDQELVDASVVLLNGSRIQVTLDR